MAQSQAVPSTATSAVEKEIQPAPSRFDLDFKGGSIRALIDAIGTARGKPLNVYLPKESESIAIAPFRVTGVTVKEILNAVSNSSGDSASGNVRSHLLHFSFLSSAEDSDSAIWSIKISDGYVEPEATCRVYSLAPYLESGLSVDDITTAVRTSWKMLNYTPSTVNLSYHRETKLLIAVAPEQELQAIEQVLSALPKGPAGRKVATAPAETSKAAPVKP